MASIGDYFKSIPSALVNATSDLLSSSDFISRTIGMSSSYEDIMFIVQALGREPISLLGKDYLFIFDHVRRNYRQGTQNMSGEYDCPKFTFYKEKPTVRFADPDNDPMNLLDRWTPNMSFNTTQNYKTELHYAESYDGLTNNKTIDDVNANGGIGYGGITASFKELSSCDLVKKTNDNFNHGKYRTLISRFHTNSDDSKDLKDPTQTAISNTYGMSHGRNLLKKEVGEQVNGYDNPYCRVWTHHHQYHTMEDAIRPFGDAETATKLEEKEKNGSSGYGVSFRTSEDKDYGIDGGSKRLDEFGVLNYKNGMVNIAPTAKIKNYFEDKVDDKSGSEQNFSIKKCMFSIENLAWKETNTIPNEYDELGLSPEQKGPLGGRIMWFPPYDLTFSEDVSVSWNSNKFIGRGESVYTYTDTERRGNLSFTMLIDHPSILDYWSGHKRNGMTNQGKVLKPGNTDGVDDVSNNKSDTSNGNRSNQENTLLRFFAGCEILTANSQKYNNKKREPNKVEEPQALVSNPPEADVSKPKDTQTIHCVLYFPNYYSGADDAPINNSSVVNTIDYLMNGMGTQKYIAFTENESSPDYGQAFDIPTVNDYKVIIDDYSGNYGGYEVKAPISIVTKPLNPNYDTITKTYVDQKSSVKRGQYLTDEDGKNIRGSYGSIFGNVIKYDLAKIIGSEALSMSAAKEEKNLTGSTHEWYRKRWYYRIDKAYENGKLSKPESHLDEQSLNLNGSGYKILLSYDSGSIAKEFGAVNNEESGESNVTLISFTDLYVALENSQGVKDVLNGCYDSNNVGIIRDIIDNPNKYKIESIKFEGHASYQGYSSSNQTLSTNRALTLKKWMSSKGFPSIDIATSDTKKESNQNNIDKGNNSTERTKLWRSASVIIEYSSTNITDAATDNDVKVNESGITQQDTVSVDNKVNSNQILSAKQWLETDAGRQFQRDYNAARKENPPYFEGNVLNGTARMVEKYPAIDPWTFTMQQAESFYGKSYTDNSGFEKDYDPSYMGGEYVKALPIKYVNRYDNEGEFFETLKSSDPFLHHLITDKIKYFDPAFHSISPEGFNARLTFLHQCTRQGSTVDNGSGFRSTAYNLAFGRPPVCVLRLGDFYYTKIIINSLSIQYESPQWDLNPEGIGVMPMFAKISMNFVFLGGSDLAGPISRLQNAVSFNYYANTSVYDNRAEEVKYDPDKTGKEITFKPFVYPDMLKTKGMTKNNTK